MSTKEEIEFPLRQNNYTFKKGKTKVIVDKCEFEWSIVNFSHLNGSPGGFIESPTFTMEKAKDIKCCLRLFPEGESPNISDFVSVYLTISIENKKCWILKVQSSLSIITAKKEKCYESKGFSNFCEASNQWGYLQFISKRDLFAQEDILLPNDCLTLVCTVTTGIDIHSEYLDQKVKKKDFKEYESQHMRYLCEKLLNDDTFHDVVLCNAEQEFRAHKSVLAAASPVFSEMLKNEQENHRKYFHLTEFPYIIEGILKFIYTGRIDKLEILDLDMLIAANKYAIVNLKKLCEKQIAEGLSIVNVCKIFDTASKCNAKELQMEAIYFFKCNRAQIMESKEYKEMKASQSQSAFDLLEAAMANKRPSNGVDNIDGPVSKKTKVIR